MKPGGKRPGVVRLSLAEAKVLEGTTAQLTTLWVGDKAVQVANCNRQFFFLGQLAHDLWHTILGNCEEGLGGALFTAKLYLMHGSLDLDIRL